MNKLTPPVSTATTPARATNDPAAASTEPLKADMPFSPLYIAPAALVNTLAKLLAASTPSLVAADFFFSPSVSDFVESVVAFM